MRHQATFIRELEGLSRPAFRIARELTLNSRSGLTVRFLAKKLEAPEEEIEYLVDVNHRLFFHDLTKVKLVAEGFPAVKRITDGLENRGDVPSMFNLAKSMGPHEFRRLEERIGIEKPGGKKAAIEDLLSRYYATTDALVEYVASREFTPHAQEVFDIIWQSKSGIIPVAKLRTLHNRSDYETEQALNELFEGFAVFEMFRFDSEERLVRVAALLSEIRQWREDEKARRNAKAQLKPVKGKPDWVETRGLDFSDKVCRLVAAIAAKPARLRGDGELFREDRRRLSEIAPEEDEPSLQTFLWIAEGVGWIARVDNELRTADLEELLNMDRIGRHRILAEWLLGRGGDPMSRRVLAKVIDEIKTTSWYSVMDFIEYARRMDTDTGQATLRNVGGHWQYAGIGTGGAGKALARSLEETFLWLGIVDRGTEDGESVFRTTELGRFVLSDGKLDGLSKHFPPEKAEIVVQPNFDIIVPTQDMDPLLIVPLEQFCVRGSTGSATVYTLTKDSFTKAVQEGHDSDRFVRFLLTHNRGGSLPNNVMTTLDDWRGGMKRVRLRTIHVLEADDPLVMADIQHRRRFAKHFESLDPRKAVAVTKISKSELARELEKEGFVVS
ncbi:MAG: hypothetical protein AMXMBFR84_31490 [Candidatus Hydrogenedentota bacterium]